MKVLFCFLSVFLLASCSTKDCELRGEVFVVTKGAQSIKLGLVDVSLIAEKDISKFVENRQIEAALAGVSLKQRYEEADRIYNVAMKDYERAKDEYEISQNGASSAYEKWVLKLRNTSVDEASSEYVASNRERQQADVKKAERDDRENVVVSKKAEMSLAQLKMNSWPTAEFLYQDMPTGVKVTTDGDGKFSLRLPNKGKFAVAAHTARQVGNSTEHYYWLTWVSMEGSVPKNVMLTNNNLMTSESPDAVMHAVTPF